jgi:predicted RND superfamily exporter protein
MNLVMRACFAHPFRTLLILLALSLLSVSQLPKLQIDASLDGLRAGSPEERQALETAVQTFGTDEVNMVLISDPDLFTPEKLAMAEEIAFKLGELPGVSRTEHLFNVNDFTNEMGQLVTGPLVSWLPEDLEEAADLKQRALANPIIADSLISTRGNAIAIELFIETGSTDQFSRLHGRIQEVLAPFESRFETLFQIGDPTLRHEISSKMLADQCRIVPLSVAVLLITLILVTRSVSCAALPLLTSGISILWIAGFMAAAGIPLNILTVIVPSLVLVVGSTEDVHLLTEYEHAIASGKARKPAIEWMIGKMGIVVMVTALSTFLGFLSICVNDVAMLRQFGYAASFGLFVNPLITCMLTPVYLKFFGRRSRRKKSSKKVKSNGLVDRMAAILTGNKRRVILICLIITAGISAFAFQVKVENDSATMFRKDALILKRLDTFNQFFPGTNTFYIHIQSGHKDLFLAPENLGLVTRLQRAMEEVGAFGRTTSIADYLMRIHHQRDPSNNPEGRLPDNRQRIAQYLALLEHHETSRYIDTDYSQVNIVVQHNINSSHELKSAVEDLENLIAEIFSSHFQATVTGDNMLTLDGADAIANGQIQSILLLLFIILIIMSVLFTNIKAGLLSLIPNAIPVLCLFGVMGIMDVPLNVGTAMVAVIAIGIAVDDTLHFMARYNSNLRRFKDQNQAMAQCIKDEFGVISATSVSLCLGFAVLGFSAFMPIVQFGLLSALVIFTAFLCDILVTPALLSSTRLLTMWDMLSLKLKKDVVERSEFFHGLRNWQIKKIVLLSRMVEQKEGSLIYSENDPLEDNPCMYLLLEGQVERYHVQSGTGKKVPVGLYAPGDIFGYISILHGSPRGSNTQALANVKYVEISSQSLARLATMYPHLWGKIHRNLARILGDQLILWQGVFAEKGGEL